MPNREMVMSKQYKGIENITVQDKELILQLFERWQQNRHRPNREDVRLLFCKYHEYVYKSPSDMGCSSCVQFIYDYWDRVTASWKKS